MLRRYALPQAALVCLMLLGALLASFAQPTQLVRAAATVATCAPDSGSATISGTVTGSGGTPLNSVLVTAYTIYGKHGGSAYTNASGVYQLTGLIGAGIVWLLRKRSNGRLIFLGLAAVVLIFQGISAFTATDSDGTAIWLNVMHLAAAGAIVPVYVRLFARSV